MTRDRKPGKNPFGRRSFIKNAALLAAGSAFGCPIMGCSSSESEIPCLGPAAAPTPVPGMTYIRASQIGCALDCDLRNGRNKATGGIATDDGPRINAAMAGATAANPITLIIDGSALISGLFLPAAGYWSIAGLGCGTGFFIKSGTNNDGIHNGPANAAVPSDPGPPAPPRGTSVSLSNFTVNGNQGDGANGDSTSGTRQGKNITLFYFGINLMNLDHIDIQNVVVVNTPAYHIRLSNVGFVSVSGCIMKSSGVNTDGLHFDGPANDITISKCEFTTGDDAIALNCPEGYSGNISRVAVTDCVFNSFSLMRLYTMLAGPNFKVDTVTVSNCFGILSEAAFNVGFEANSSDPDSVASLTVSNCTLTAPAVLEVGENFGNITLNNVTFTPAASNLPSGILRPSPSPLFSGAIHGSSLSLQNCVIYRNSDFDVAALVLANNSVIDNLEFNGFQVTGTGSYPAITELLQIQGGSIGQLVLNSLNTSNIKALSAGGFSNIASVIGAGVLATGWKFPNGVMGDEVPFLSAASGLPSIKVRGVIQPFQQD